MMTLVDDDQVEEIGRELADVVFILGTSNCLVRGQADLVTIDLLGSLVDSQAPASSVLTLPAASTRSTRLAFRLSSRSTLERAEVIDHGLVDQDVAIGQEQDALLGTAFPEAR